jgi:hypothetical protein
MSKQQRARALISLVLLGDAAITWLFFKEHSGSLTPPGEFGLLCTLPSLAALVWLLAKKELSGARPAQVVAWSFVFFGALGWTYVLVFSFGSSSSDRLWSCLIVGSLLAAQMLIPASVAWARGEVSFLRSLARHSAVFTLLVLVAVLGLFTS